MSLFVGVNAGVVLCLFLAAGGLLLWRGLRVRRVGSEPRCRECGYNLTGATSQVCPECGRTIDVHGVVFGTRKRRAVALVSGALIILSVVAFTGFAGYRRVQTVNKYRFYPFDWVFADAGAGVRAAATELERRVSTGVLDPGQRDRLVKAALDEQAGPLVSTLTQSWVDMLEFLYQADDLSDAQTKRYFEQVRIYTLMVREQVCVGEPIPIGLRYVGRGPNLPIQPGSHQGRWIAVDIDCADIDVLAAESGEPIDQRFRSSGRIKCAMSGNRVNSTGSCGPALHNNDLSPGGYEVALEFAEYVYGEDAGESFEEGAPIFSRQLQVTGSFEIVSRDACDAVQLVDDASIQASIRDALALGPLEVSRHDKGRAKSYVNMMVHTGAGTIAGAVLPIDVAFDVSLRCGDDEWELGTIVLRAGTNMADHIHGQVTALDVDTVDVVLRSSVDAARKTVDVTRIWDGELVFENIPVERQED